MVMKGMTWTTLKGHPALMPLFFFLGLGVGGAAFYTVRLAVRDPDTTWNRKSNPEPWNEYTEKQFKFYSPSLDYSQVKSPAPKY